MDVRRAASVWKTMMDPYDIEMEDISNIFVDTISNVTNVRYFKAQEIAHGHQVEEKEINNGLCVNVGLKDDASNPFLKDIHEQLLREDVVAGITEGAIVNKVALADTIVAKNFGMVTL